MNPYQVLGVKKTDDSETIKRAYRKAVKECHPDTHPGDQRAEERFKEAAKAYEILSDTKKREDYDKKHMEKQKKPGNGKKTEVNKEMKKTSADPMDVTKMFEEYMGFKF